MLIACRTQLYLGSQSEALAHLDAALAVAQEAGDEAALGEAMAYQGYMQVAQGSESMEDGISSLDLLLSECLHRSHKSSCCITKIIHSTLISAVSEPPAHDLRSNSSCYRIGS